jgi:hypothetical protein
MVLYRTFSGAASIRVIVDLGLLLKPGFLQHLGYLRQVPGVAVRLGRSIFIKSKIRADPEYLTASLAGLINSIQGGIGAGQQFR